MQQHYVLDYAYTMNGLPPFTLPMPTGWITISNLRINDAPISGPPYTVTIAASTPFTFKYDIVASSSIPFSPLPQHIYGNIIDNSTGQILNSSIADGTWDTQITASGTHEVAVSFNGITTGLSLTLNVGHWEYAIFALSNNASWGIVAIQNPAATYYPNQPVALTATPIGPATFLNWTLNSPGGTIIGTNTTLNYTMGGSDVTIYGNFQSAGAPITCSAGIDQTGIVNNPVTFTGSGSGGTGSLTFNWAFGDGQAGVGNPIQHTYISAGTFTAIVTVTDGSSTPCTDAAYAIISTAPCATGQEQCIDSIKWVCINGVWQQTAIPCCNPNDTRCFNEEYQICGTNNDWQPTGVVCCVPNTDKCKDGLWNKCNPAGDGWIPSEYPCQQNIPIEYIIIGGVAVVGGLIAIAAASGGLGGYAIGRRRRK
jgi:hypothetical protein